MYSLKEASKLWNVEESTLRRAILNDKLQKDIDAKKFGKQWVVLEDSMNRVYGFQDSFKANNEKYSENKLMDIYHYESECLNSYSNLKKITSREASKKFDEYNIYSYIYDCYDYLHLGNKNDVIKDISSRIRRGIKYDR